MDIFQIIIRHNPAWTRREFVLYLFVMLAYLFLARYLVKTSRLSIPRAIAIAVLLSFMAVVTGSTVFTRVPSGRYAYELQPFWSVKAYFAGDKELGSEILLNILLLVPFGFLIPFCFGRRVKPVTGLLFGFVFSCTIETLQLILQRGLFEFDDMMTNSLGSLIGCLIGNLVLVRLQRIYSRTGVKE